MDQEARGFAPPPTRVAAVTDELRQEILEGTLPPGAPVRDAELAARLGVSITPVREALAALISEGLVEALPNKRRRVARMTQRQAEELMDLLGAVVVAGLERVAPHSDTERLASLMRDFAAAADAGDAEGSGRVFLELTDELFELAGNGELSLLAGSVMRRSLGRIRLYPADHLLPLWADAFREVADLLPVDLPAAGARVRRFFGDLLAEMARNRSEGEVATPQAGTAATS